MCFGKWCSETRTQDRLGERLRDGVQRQEGRVSEREVRQQKAQEGQRSGARAESWQTGAGILSPDVK